MAAVPFLTRPKLMIVVHDISGPFAYTWWRGVNTYSYTAGHFRNYEPMDNALESVSLNSSITPQAD